MQDQTIGEAIAYLKTQYPRTYGCSTQEIQELETACQLKLPAAYRQFLLYFGRDAGAYMIGSDFTYGWLMTMKDGANELLAENGLAALPEDTFVFWMHQGYQFCFFHCNDAIDNPPVYYYNECSDEPGIVQMADSLTAFLMDAASTM